MRAVLSARRPYISYFNRLVGCHILSSTAPPLLDLLSISSPNPVSRNPRFATQNKTKQK